MKTINLIIWICVTVIGELFLLSYYHMEMKSCDCHIKNDHLIVRAELQETNRNINDSKTSPSNATYIRQNVVDFSSILYFEPLLEESFPTNTNSVPRIPHIIHQTYKNDHIPKPLIGYVRSMVKFNPNWTYIFWTDESSRKFVEERFPNLLQMWDSYRSPINRADAIRYLILYEFGGFYADLDVECKRPLDNITFNYACIIPPEPFEQSVFRVKIPYLLTNAIMMCRPKHPFLKHIIDTLHQYVPMLEKLDVAGPAFVTSQFIRYNNITAESLYSLKQSNESNSPYFYKGELPEDNDDAVYVPNTQYFINSLSLNWMTERDYKLICARQGPQIIKLIKACNELRRRLSQTDRDKFAFTDHKWFHSYDRKKKELRNYRDLNKIVNNFKIYKGSMKVKT